MKMTQRISRTSAAVALLALLASPLGAKGEGEWGGFYAAINSGANLAAGNANVNIVNDGYTFASADRNLIEKFGKQQISSLGIPVSLSGGYNIQAGNWVGGIFAEYGFSPVHAQAKVYHNYQSYSTGFWINQSVDADTLLSVRPKLGYAFGDWLISGSAGLAFSQLRYDMHIDDFNYGSGFADKQMTQEAWGWLGAVSAEYMIAPHWALSGEYSYVDLGGQIGSTSSNNGFSTVFGTRFNLIEQNAKVGLNYHY